MNRIGKCLTGCIQLILMLLLLAVPAWADEPFPELNENGFLDEGEFVSFDSENGINSKRPVLKSKIDWYLSHNYWLILDINIKELQIKKGVTAPFLMKSKLTPESKATDILHVNGKVVKISGGCARVTITSDDYLIYREQYDFKMSVIACDALYVTIIIRKRVNDLRSFCSKSFRYLF